MIRFARRLAICAAWAFVVATYAAGARADAPAAGEVALVVEGLPWDIDPESVRVAIGREIGSGVVLAGKTPDGKASLVLRGEPGRRVALTYRSPEGGGKHIERTIDLPEDPENAAETIALLAGNLTRDEAAELAAMLGKRPEAEPSVEEAIEPSPTPAEPVVTEKIVVAPPERETLRDSANPPVRPAMRRRTVPNDTPVPSPCARPTNMREFAGADVVPHLGTSRFTGTDTVRAISANLLAGYSRGLSGLEIGFGLNIQREFACGVQVVGVGNVVAREVRGMQLALGFNYANNLNGTQIGGVNVAPGSMYGVQAGAVDYASDVRGVQLGAVTIADEVTGWQIGGINIATGDVKGVQIGLINYADTSTYSFGLINIVRRGRLHFDVWGQESGVFMAGFEHGSDHFHNIYGAGFRATGDEPRAVFTLGLGGRVVLSERLSLDIDVLGYSHHDIDDLAPTAFVAQARALVSVNLGGHLGAFAGPSYSVVAAISPAEAQMAPYDTSNLDPNSNPLLGWPGITVGVRTF